MCFTGDHVFHDVLLDGTFFYDHLYVLINKSFPRIALKACRIHLHSIQRVILGKGKSRQDMIDFSFVSAWQIGRQRKIS